jgi:hypothetical protein
MQLLGLIFLLLRFFLRDKANIRNARDADVYCIRAETVSIRALLLKLLAVVAQGRGGGRRGVDSAGGWRRRLGQPSVMPPRSHRGISAALAALAAAAGSGDQRWLFSILEHSMFLNLRKTDYFTSIRPVQQCIVKYNANVMEVHCRRMSLQQERPVGVHHCAIAEKSH